MKSLFTERLRAAWEILCGRLEIADDGDKENGAQYFRCAKEHVGPNEVRVKKSDFDKLNQAADQLKIARGYIANSENRQAYVTEVNDTLANISK